MTLDEAEKMLSEWIEPKDSKEITRATTLIMMREAYAKGVKDTEKRMFRDQMKEDM